MQLYRVINEAGDEYVIQAEDPEDAVWMLNYVLGRPLLHYGAYDFDQVTVIVIDEGGIDHELTFQFQEAQPDEWDESTGSWELISIV